MSHVPSIHDRRAYVACTALAVAIVVGVWLWGVRLAVADGLAGTRALIGDVAETAADARDRARPDAAAVAAVRDGFAQMAREREEEDAARAAAVDAVAGMIAEGMGGGGETGTGISEQGSGVSDQGTEGVDGAKGTDGTMGETDDGVE